MTVPMLVPDGMGSRVVMPGQRTKQVGRKFRSEAERRQAEPWRRHYDEAYRQARQRALDATGGRCARCGRVIAERRPDGTWAMCGGEVHHSIPLADGGERSALVPLCIPCHRQADAALRARDGR